MFQLFRSIPESHGREVGSSLPRQCRRRLGIFPSMEHKLLSPNVQQLETKKRRRIKLRLSVAQSRRFHNVWSVQLRSLLDTVD